MLLIVGPGAVGTVIAGFLGAAGRPLRLQCTQHDLPAVAAAEGIAIERVTGGPALVGPRPLLTTSADPDEVRQALICVKHPDLDAALDGLPAGMQPDTPLVSTLNGVGALRRIRERFPGHPVLPATILFNAQLLEPLHARVSARPQIGIPREHDATVALFRGSGLRVRPARGEAAAWGKLLFNLSAGIAALTHSTFREVLTVPGLRAVYADLLEEGAEMLRTAGIDFSVPVGVPLTVFLRLLRHNGGAAWRLAAWRLGLGDGAYPSMVSDLAHGRRTEIDLLSGEIAGLARRNGLAAERNQRIVELVTAAERGETRIPMTADMLEAAMDRRQLTVRPD